MTQSISCADYLNTLTQHQLRCWVRLNLSYDQIANVWLALNGKPMSEQMKDSHLSYCIIELCDTYNRSELANELSKQCGNNYKLLPDANQLKQIIIDLINKAKEENLTTLDLSCLTLAILPNNLFKLSNLENLYLVDNLLTTLPDDISSLKSLIVLDLYKNEINFISPEIGSLSNLSYLDLSFNQLSSLPSEIGSLSKLSMLGLSFNQLSNLPSEIGFLSNLTTLDLSYNQLTSLPDDFSSLSNLSELYLSENQLTSLPNDFSNLTNLRRFRLQGNDSLAIPPEILELWDEPSKILNYYSKLLSKQEKRKLNEAKMLVVGEGKVGKTSIINKLVHNIFNDSEPMTEGVIIKKHWPITLSDNREIKLNIWDFGGQEIMHATHQFFLTKRSLYLLVLDSRQDEQQNRLDYWLKTIDNFADDAPIIIVCNQIDVKPLELDQKTLKAKYPNIKAFVSTSCKTGKGINTLKEVISEEISKLKHIDDLLVDSWFKVKEELENLQKNHIDYLEYSEYQQMCRQQNIDVLSQETLISLLHALGTILCFYEDLRVSATYILNPDWVTEGIYKIINNRELAEKYKGVLQISALSHILNSEKYPKNKYLFIIEMMRKFGLCFDIEDLHRDKLLIPGLLPKKPPELGNWDDSLRFEYHYDLLPSSIISRFIVSMNVFIYDNTYWRYGVVLESEDKQNKALIKADLDARKIFIFVDGRAETRKDLLSLIRADFLKIHKTIPKLQVEQKIPLPEDPNIILDYEYLLQALDLGDEFVIAKGYNKKIPIKPLLEGVDKKLVLMKPYFPWKSSALSNKLSGQEQEKLQKVLLDAFNISSLKQMLAFKLDKNLDTITTANGFSNVVFDLITTANKEGWIVQLIISAREYIPGNSLLANISTTLLTKLEVAPYDYLGFLEETIIASEPKDTNATNQKSINILHLSDIHLGTVEQSNIYYNQLQLDLTQHLVLGKLDYLIISGDIANKSTKDEYEAAFKLINQIKINFSLKDKQVIVAPGNHDLNWDLSEEAYQTHIPKRKLPSTLTDAYIPIETGALLRDEEEYKKRFDNFSEFYKEITGNAYPSNYEDQAILHTFTEDKLLVLSLNSAWQIDHHYTNRAGINPNALGKALSNTNSYKDWLKVAVWHHPVTGQETIKNTGFLEQLAVAGFEVCLHGHIHEAISNFYSYDSNRGLHIIGGGTFGAPAKAQVTSIPLQYNLLVLEPSKASITVKTRKKEKVHGAWSADARWGDKEAPKAFYQIQLKKAGKQTPYLPATTNFAKVTNKNKSARKFKTNYNLSNNDPSFTGFDKSQVLLDYDISGKTNAEVVTSLTNLASFYSQQNNFSQAENLYKEALRIYRSKIGKKHPEVAVILNNLALLYSQQNNFSQAENLYKEALRIYRFNLGEDHPEVATILNNLALLYSQQNNFSQAENLYKETLRIYRFNLGENHPEVATILNNLALLYSQQNNFSQAENLYKEALNIYKLTLNNEGIEIIKTLHNLSKIYFLKNNASQVDTYQEIQTRIKNLFLLHYSNLIDNPNIVKMIKVEIDNGNGFFLNKQKTLSLKITNLTTYTIQAISFKLENSANYETTSSDFQMQIIYDLKPKSNQTLNVEVTANTTGSITLNLKVNDEFYRPPLDICVVTDNPYFFGPPVKDNLNFFGRESELEKTLTNIISNNGNTMIIGEQRSGKTSLLYQIINRLKLPHIPIFITFSGSDSDDKTALSWLLYKILNELKSQNILSNIDNYKTKLTYSADFIDYLKQIIKDIKILKKHYQLILLLDEGHLINRINIQFQETLREAFNDMAEDIKVVFACYYSFFDSCQTSGSPLQNIFNYIFLKPLEDEALTKLITEPAHRFNYLYEEESLKAIKNIAGGHPAYTQLLCRCIYTNIVNNPSKYISIVSVNVAEKEVLNNEKERFKMGYWNYLTEIEKRFLYSLINKKFNPNISIQVINNLINKCIIKELNGSYQLTCTLFENWIKELLKENY